MATFTAPRPPMVSNAFKPMLVFSVVTVLLGIILQVWAHGNEARHREIQFWTGGFGVFGVVAVGCMTYVLVWGARVFDDSLRGIQRDAHHITEAATKTTNQLGRGLSLAGALENLMEKVRPKD